MGYLQGHVCVLLHEYDGGSLLRVDPADNAKDLLDHKGGKSQGWFIQKQQFRVGHERPAHDEHLQLAAAAVPCQRFSPLYQCREVVIDHLQVFLVRLHPASRRTHLEVLLDGEILEWFSALEHLDDPLAGDLFRGRVLDIVSVVQDGPVSHLAVFRFEQP